MKKLLLAFAVTVASVFSYGDTPTAFVTKDTNYRIKLSSGSYKTVGLHYTFDAAPDGHTISSAYRERVKDYLTWKANFVVTFDCPIKKDSVVCYGKVKGSGILSLLNTSYTTKSCAAMAAGAEKVLIDLDDEPTYSTLLNLVGAFYAGINNVSSDNYGTTVMIALRIYNPNDRTDFIDVYHDSFTFESPTEYTNVGNAGNGRIKWVHDVTLANSKAVGAKWDVNNSGELNGALELADNGVEVSGSLDKRLCFRSDSTIVPQENANQITYTTVLEFNPGDVVPRSTLEKNIGEFLITEPDAPSYICFCKDDTTGDIVYLGGIKGDDGKTTTVEFTPMAPIDVSSGFVEIVCKMTFVGNSAYVKYFANKVPLSYEGLTELPCNRKLDSASKAEIQFIGGGVVSEIDIDARSNPPLRFK